MKKIIIAPDSFKGTLSSLEVCETVSAELIKRYPDCEIVSLPIADGGEGTTDAFLCSVGICRNPYSRRKWSAQNISAAWNI